MLDRRIFVCRLLSNNGSNRIRAPPDLEFEFKNQISNQGGQNGEIRTKKVFILEKTDLKENGVYKQKRVVAYCRISTKQEEQMNSYETQKNHYTEKINAEPGWTLVGIFADEGMIYGGQKLKF